MLRWLLPVAALTAASLPCEAGEGRRVRVCLSVKGIAGEQAAQLRAQIQKILDRERAPADGFIFEDSCCATQPCLKKESEGGRLSGLLAIDILRLGPLLKLTVRGFDVRSQASVFELASTVPMRDFPEKSSVAADLRRALLALGISRPAPLPEPPPPPLATTPAAKEPAKTEIQPPPPKMPPVAPAANANPAKDGHAPDAPSAFISVQRTDNNRLRSALLWLGGVSTGVAAGAMATGLALVLGPMKSAQDRRDQAYQEWLAATTIEEMERLRGVVRAEDDKAKKYWIGGLSALGAGALLLGGGLACFWLAPTRNEGQAPGPTTLSVSPWVSPTGAGLGLSAPF